MGRIEIRTDERFEDELSALVKVTESDKSVCIRRAVHLLHHLKCVERAVDVEYVRWDGTPVVLHIDPDDLKGEESIFPEAKK